MKIGLTDIIDAKRGTTQISKIMRGTVLIWEKVVAVVNTLEDYIARVLADSGIVENETQLDLEVDFTSQQYLDAIAIYNPNGGKKVGKIYDVRDTDNTSPNDITVTGGGGTRFLADGTLEAVPFEIPKIDYSTGSAKFLIEPERTNVQRYSSNLNISSGGYNVIYSYDQVGIFGQPNTAMLLTDTSSTLSNGTVIDSGTGTAKYYQASVWIKKDQDETRFPAIMLYEESSYYHRIKINTKTGATIVSVAGGNHLVKSRGDWWELLLVAGDGVGDLTGFKLAIYPAFSTVWDSGYENGAQGSLIIGHVDISPQGTKSTVSDWTPIITDGVVVTRTAAEASITVPSGVTSIEEKVDGVVNTITTIPTTYTMPNGAVEYVKFL